MNSSETQKICINCVKDSYLKRYIKENGIKDKCSICEKNEVVCEVLEKGFKTILKAVIRYHYSERVYNSHWGGYSNWIDIFSEVNEIFNFFGEGGIVVGIKRIGFNPELEEKNLERKYDTFFEALEEIEGHIKDYDKDVSLYFGGGRLDHFASSIKNDSSFQVTEIKRKIDNINYHYLFAEMKDVLEKGSDRIIHMINDEEFYRARIGIKDWLIDEDSIYFDECDEVFLPYINGDISSPPIKIASEGRLNRKGCSFLYLASDKNTAISEVKPSTGHQVSVGKFKFRPKTGGWKIADFSNVDFYNYYMSDNDIDLFIILNSIKKELSIPNPDKDYRLTQLIADVLISMNIHGVLFKSSLSDGDNLVVFHPLNAEYITSSHEVVKIEDVCVKFSNLDCELKDGVLYTKSDGKCFEEANYYQKKEYPVLNFTSSPVRK